MEVKTQRSGRKEGGEDRVLGGCELQSLGKMNGNWVIPFSLSPSSTFSPLHQLAELWWMN